MTLFEAKRIKIGAPIYNRYVVWHKVTKKAEPVIIGKTIDGKLKWFLPVIGDTSTSDANGNYICGKISHVWTITKPDWYSKYGEKGVAF